MVHSAWIRASYAEDDHDGHRTVKVGIIAALPREVSALVKGWEHRRLPNHVHVYSDGHAVVACAGMGEARAALAVQAALAAMPVTALLSVGLAGACDPALRVGDVVRAGVVIDAGSGERFDNSRYKQVVVTTDAIVSVWGKAQMHSLYWAAATDMEAAGVARLAKAHKLEFQAIKAISDESDFEVDSLTRFATADGQFREAAFALYAAVRPAMWSTVMTLARNSGKAIAALTATLEDELDWYRKTS
jgi:adenosylhomocysteine nucleosidase